MVVVRLDGGLGNQMFQYACARRLAHVRSVDLKLDISPFAQGSLRSFALDGFRIAAITSSDGEVRIFRLKARLGTILHKRTKRRFGLPIIVRNHSLEFDATIRHLDGNVYLDGYWQSEKYFSDIADLLRSDFRLAQPLPPSEADLLKAICSTNSVAVHVRRGDYVSNPAVAAKHGLCSDDYYRNAVRLMRSHVPDAHLFVFSDEPDWVRRNMEFEGPYTIVQSSGAASHHHDLTLMSSCRHQIIANSSFSWWGAWLNVNPEKIVVSPSSWFREEGHDSGDLVPEPWLRV